MPKATRKSSDDTEEHGSSAVTNPQEAKDHIMDLEALMKNMKEKIEAGNMTDLLKQTLENIKLGWYLHFHHLIVPTPTLSSMPLKIKNLKYYYLVRKTQRSCWKNCYQAVKYHQHQM